MKSRWLVRGMGVSPMFGFCADRGKTRATKDRPTTSKCTDPVPPLRSRLGFTLIELLVVLALVATLAGVMGYALRDTGSVAALRATERLVAGHLANARAQAVLHQTTARLILAADKVADSGRYLRYVGVIYRDPADAARWIAAGEGSAFPQGVYFWQELSDALPTLSLEFPRGESVAEGTGPQWYFLEFSANGQMAAPTRLVFGVPECVEPAGVSTVLQFDKASTPIGGVVVNRWGAVALAENPEDWRR
ncbi:MAG: type II secretion system protein [Verrucomicrobiota bacterium]|nr:type II secretion system protein [Verrucomicrobiota bacterium]